MSKKIEDFLPIEGKTTAVLIVWDRITEEWEVAVEGREIDHEQAITVLESVLVKYKQINTNQPQKEERILN